ncbi:MAG: MbnP family copper-binding protein [Polyangiales bacterium]
MLDARRWTWSVVSLVVCGLGACSDASSDTPEQDPDEQRAEPDHASETSEPSEPEIRRPEATSPDAAAPEAAVDPTRVTIPFVASVNDMPLDCGTLYPDVGTARSTLELSDFRMFVHDVQLLDDAGKTTPVELDQDGEFQVRYMKEDGSEGGLALLDFATLESDVCTHRGTASTNRFVSGHAPEGNYTKLAFTIGVPPELNHVDGSVSAAPLNSYGMQWSWASGYRHMKVEVQATTGDKVKETYYFHPGAVGCTSDNGAISGRYACTHEMTSRIEVPFKPGSQAIAADLARLFADSDLSTGRGCMGTSTLSDPDVDGKDVLPTTGCAEVWATLGLRMGKSAADGVETGPQTMFASIAYNEALAPRGEPVDVATLSDEETFGWPHPDYERDPLLDVAAFSLRNGQDSHPEGDERYGANCMTCHGQFGPGKGRFSIAGTVVDDEGGVYAGGGFVQLGLGEGNRSGPTVHPIADKIRDFETLFEVPIDANGQFYATADQAPELSYAERSYFARIVGREGTCKTKLGAAVPDATGVNVSCTSDADCASMRYAARGQCMSAAGEAIMEDAAPRGCDRAEDCDQEGATCRGAERDAVPVCDKLLNAMPLAAVGSCNFCHGEGFRIHTKPTL